MTREFVRRAIEGDHDAFLVIEKDIDLRGDGPVEEVVIELAGAVLISLIESDAEVANLTLRGDECTQGMEVRAGAPTISGVVFDGTGRPYGALGSDGCIGRGSLSIRGGNALVLDNRFAGGGEIMVTADSDSVFEKNELTDGPHLYLHGPGDEAVVRGNTIRGTFDRAMGLFGPSAMTIEGNTIDGAGGDGITVGWDGGAGALAGVEPVIRGNTISGTGAAIHVFGQARPVIEGNEISGNQSGIAIDGPGVSVVLTGNFICDNETNLIPAANAEPPVFDDSNTICEDAPAE